MPLLHPIDKFVGSGIHIHQPAINAFCAGDGDRGAVGCGKLPVFLECVGFTGHLCNEGAGALPADLRSVWRIVIQIDQRLSGEFVLAILKVIHNLCIKQLVVRIDFRYELCIISPYRRRFIGFVRNADFRFSRRNAFHNDFFQRLLFDRGAFFFRFDRKAPVFILPDFCIDRFFLEAHMVGFRQQGTHFLVIVQRLIFHFVRMIFKKSERPRHRILMNLRRFFHSLLQFNIIWLQGQCAVFFPDDGNRFVFSAVFK